MEKLDLYNALREVPKEAQKPFNNGRFNGTDINPMWRIKKMTETFGPCGIGWYFGEPKFDVRVDGGVTTVHCTLPLYIKDNGEWSAPIFGVGGNTLMTAKGGVSDEAYKMAYTDAQSNATKLIGLGGDIWFANDRTKYTAKPKAQAADEVADAINACKTIGDLEQVWKKMSKEMQGLYRLDVVSKKQHLESKTEQL